MSFPSHRLIVGCAGPALFLLTVLVGKNSKNAIWYLFEHVIVHSRYAGSSVDSYTPFEASKVAIGCAYSR
jgi:hypothetical protein